MKHDVVHTQVSFLVVKYGNNSTLFHLEAAAVDGLLPAYHSFVLCVIAWCRALPIKNKYNKNVHMSAKTARQQQDGQHSFDLSGGERLLLS